MGGDRYASHARVFLTSLTRRSKTVFLGGWMLWPSSQFLFHPRDMRGQGDEDVGQLLRHALKANKFARRGKDAEKSPWENKHVCLGK